VGEMSLIITILSLIIGIDSLLMAFGKVVPKKITGFIMMFIFIFIFIFILKNQLPLIKEYWHTKNIRNADINN